MATYNSRTCFFTENNIQYIDYKNTELLKKFVTKYKKITPRYYSGVSLKHQKKLARAIKNARYMALMPYTAQ